MSAACRRCLVSGRVQGVFFRASALEQGRSHGLRVKARNLADGRVEVIAVGAGEDLDRFCAWLREGPPQAAVTAVECTPVDPAEYDRFAGD